MSRSSARGYVEPLAALAAVFAMSVGLTVYVAGLEESMDESDRSEAATILGEIRAEATELGVLDPTAIEVGTGEGRPVPQGWHANVTLATRAGRWTRGPVAPPDADRATARVSVRLGHGTIRPGKLTVEAWQ